MKKVEIYDTTLRDGAQAEGISFSVNDKLKIISLLDKLGIDYIEAGWPGANPKDIEVFERLKSLKLNHAKITSFGCTRRAGIKASEDTVLKSLLDSGTEIVTIFGKTWDFHVEHALNTTLKENLEMIFDSVEYLKSQNKRVFFDAEHFFDGYKNNPEYALKAIKNAFDAGAERIILCDTNGGCTPCEVETIVKKVKEFLPEAVLGIHAHNDGDLAVANSLSAVKNSVLQVQGTFNGYGERCGNANLCSIIPNLQLKVGLDVLNEKIFDLTPVSRQISEIANKPAFEHAPFVGRSAFAHKAGIHASGVQKNSQTYEHIEPEKVGNSRRILVSDQAGAASIRHKLENVKLGFEVNETDIPQIIEKIKHYEWQGLTFEDANASFELILARVKNIRPEFFDVMGFRIIGDTTLQNQNEINTEASVKIKVGKELIHTVSEGDGPVHALDMALRKALSPIYPEVKDFKLVDFKVRILDSKDGTDAKTRVHVETSDGVESWDTVGISRNVIEASYNAIVDSIIYGLMLKKVQAK